jgi:tetratricopeptide (TPR) repeat protein
VAEGILTANLIRGRYDEAEKLVAGHQFAPRHRTYGLRDRYRFLRYGMGAAAFRKGEYAQALELFASALKPPVSLGVDDFASQTMPRVEYAVGRALEALGKGREAQQAYQRAIQGVDQLSGDRDSWNSENFYMVPALERLGRKEEAAALIKHFEEFARSQLDARLSHWRAEARYMLALVKQHDGNAAEARTLMEDAVKTQPDFVAARLALRGDAL